MNEARKNIKLHCVDGSLVHVSTNAFLASFRLALLAPPHIGGAARGPALSLSFDNSMALYSLAGNVSLLSVDITPFGRQLYDHSSTSVN